ncbi:unnamed protein product [Mortierella alpina]
MSCPAGYTLDPAPRVAPFAAVTETMKPGQRITYWDCDVIWTENHLPASKLEPLRNLGDLLSDETLAALEIKPGEDALEALLAYTAQPSEKQKSLAPQQLLTQVMTVPDWVDWDRIQRGRQVYWRYYLIIKFVLIHLALAGGTSMLKTSNVMYSTGHLYGKYTKQRIAETADFLQDVFNSLENLQPGSGPGWKSIVRIRFLHSGVRARFLKPSREHPKHYNVEEYGVPINQEDLLGVLFGLSSLMWRSMEVRLGVYMTTQEREDYLHLWRYVAYMIGVDDILRVTETPERADAYLESMRLHLSDPHAESGRLLSTWARNLYPRSKKAFGLLDRYNLHMAISEQLMGPELWKMHELPSATWPMNCPAGCTLDSTPRVAPHIAATENYKPGQRLQYCDFHTIWTEHHIPASKLEPLRSLGDPLSDDALAALEIKPGEDALEALLAYTAHPSDEQKSPAPHQLLKQVMTLPEWVDWDRIQRGQIVYRRYCFYINVILIHFTVGSGLSVPKITKVLSSTGYLQGKKAQNRVLESGQFVLDVFHSPEFLQPGSGTAWKSIIQIRLLHSAVRARLSKIAHAHSKYYNLEEYGVPINQEDLLGILFTLSNAMWRMMKRLDVDMTAQERGDYLHVWRYVGHMMGVDDVLGATQTPQRADACLDSIVIHIADPGKESGRLASTLFRNFNPRSKPLARLDRHKIHLALAERLFGPELWEVNGLPPITWPYRVVRELIYSLIALDLWLVTYSPRWFRLRSSLFLKAENRAIARKLGKARTQFELKEMPAFKAFPRLGSWRSVLVVFAISKHDN